MVKRKKGRQDAKKRKKGRKDGKKGNEEDKAVKNEGKTRR
jgi:hypothetical protein